MKVFNRSTVSHTLIVRNIHDELFQAQWVMWKPTGPQSQSTWTQWWRTEQCRSLPEIEHRCMGWTTVFNFRQGQTFFCPSSLCPRCLSGLPSLRSIGHTGMFLRRLSRSKHELECFTTNRILVRLTREFSPHYLQAFMPWSLATLFFLLLIVTIIMIVINVCPHHLYWYIFLSTVFTLTQFQLLSSPLINKLFCVQQAYIL
jgi:hypothetical protein